MSTKEMMRTLLCIGQVSGNDTWAVDAALRVANADTIIDLADVLTDALQQSQRFAQDLCDLVDKLEVDEVEVEKRKVEKLKVDKLEVGGLLADLAAMTASMRALAAVLPPKSRPAFDADLSDRELAALDDLLAELPEVDEDEYAAMLSSLVEEENIEASAVDMETDWMDRHPGSEPTGDGVRRWPFYRPRAANKIRSLAPELAAHGITGFEQYADQFLDADVDAADLAEHLYALLDALAFEALGVGATARFEAVAAASEQCYKVMHWFAVYAE